MNRKWRCTRPILALVLAAVMGMGCLGNVWAAETKQESIQESGDSSAAAGQSESQSQNESENQMESESRDESESQTTDTEVPDSDIPVGGDGRLKIEDVNIYKGMEKAYKDGYEPVVSEGKAVIVLPVVAGEGLTVSEITVTPNLGDTAMSPFVYKNYQKTFRETDEQINNSKETKKVFLVSYELPLSKDRTNGTYPVVLDITARSGGTEIAQSFTVYVRITDGKSKDDGQGTVEAGGDETPDPESQPKLILSKCTAVPERIEAGSEFELKVEIKNTNKNFYVQNMTIDVSWTEPGLTLEADSKTFFVEKLGSEQSMELPLKFKADSNVAEGRYDITLNMSYDNPEAVSMSSSGMISVDIHQAMRVELEADEFPESVNAGDTFTLAVQAINLGRGKIYNARCLVDVPGLSSGTSTFFGNIEAGNAVSGELKIFAGMKDEEKYDSAYGSTRGKLILSYEDEDGNEYTDELEVSTVVNPLVINTPAEEESEQEGSGLALQWGVGVAVILVLLVSAALIIRRRKKNGEA